MVKSLTLKELGLIIDEINKNHHPFKGGNQKYMDLCFDFRTNTIFRVVMRPFGTVKEFTCTNRGQMIDGKWVEDPDGTLYDEIMQWLKQN